MFIAQNAHQTGLAHRVAAGGLGARRLNLNPA
jgi:hypothetical protein